MPEYEVVLRRWEPQEWCVSVEARNAAAAVRMARADPDLFARSDTGLEWEPSSDLAATKPKAIRAVRVPQGDKS